MSNFWLNVWQGALGEALGSFIVVALGGFLAWLLRGKLKPLLKRLWNGDSISPIPNDSTNKHTGSTCEFAYILYRQNTDVHVALIIMPHPRRDYDRADWEIFWRSRTKTIMPGEWLPGFSETSPSKAQNLWCGLYSSVGWNRLREELNRKPYHQTIFSRSFNTNAEAITFVEQIGVVKQITIESKEDDNKPIFTRTALCFGPITKENEYHSKLAIIDGKPL